MNKEIVIEILEAVLKVLKQEKPVEDKKERFEDYVTMSNYIIQNSKSQQSISFAQGVLSYYQRNSVMSEGQRSSIKSTYDSLRIT